MHLYRPSAGETRALLLLFALQLGPSRTLEKINKSSKH